MVFFLVILGIFRELWQAVADAGMPLAAEPRALVWYLAITEWVLLSVPAMHLEVHDLIRRGDVAYHVGRPVSFVGAAVAEGCGILAVRSPVLLATAYAGAAAFTSWTPSPVALLVLVPLGLCAAALLTTLYVGLGLLTFWVGDIAPLSWVFQKALFVLGGLMMPLAVYPDTIQWLASITPFSATLAAPAALVLGAPLADAWWVFARLLFWGGATTLGLSWISRRALVRLTVNGG